MNVPNPSHQTPPVNVRSRCFTLLPWMFTALWLAPLPLVAEGVRVDKHAVHPTRILARLQPGPQALAGPGLTGTLAGLGLEVRRQYSSVPGLMLFDEPGAPAQASGFAGGELEARRTRLLERMQALRASGWFAYVEPDYLVRTQLEPTDSAFVNGTLWGLRNLGLSGGLPGADINATNAWNLTTGDTNVIVAVIDTGINYNHLDLAAQMWRNPGEIPGNGLDDDGNGYVDDVHGINAITGSGHPLDDNDHGSHCAGTIGAAANDGNPHVGVAWQVRLMACKFLGAAGGGNTSDAIECVDYAVAKRAKILSNSWGGGGFSQALLDAILAANTQNMLFVAAAGNDSRNTDTSPSYPATYEADNVISVAAVNRTDGLAGFSNYGATSVDLGAPGVDIYSTVSGPNNAYDTFDGTSMACPHVAGVAALLAARYTTNITVAEMRQRLLESTTPVPALSGRTGTGGRLNAFQALSITEDGTLDVRLNFAGGLPLRAGSTAAVYVIVTDLVPINTATVKLGIQGGELLTVVNDGSGPDTVAGDHIHSANLVVPLAGNQVVLDYEVSAPGKLGVTGSLTAPILVPPPNDNFANRIPLVGSSNRVFATSLGASAEPGEPAHHGSAAFKSVWWTWTAPASDTVTIQTTGSSFDTTLAAYTGASLGSLVMRASNDDAGGALTSLISFAATAGVTYQIAVDGFSGDSGDIVLTVFQPPPAEPVIIQQPADQFALAGGSVTFTVQASGAPTLTFQWYLDNAPLATATNASWTVSPVGAENIGLYQVLVTNGLGSATSHAAQLRIIDVGNGFFDDFEPAEDAPQWSGFSGEVVANDYGGSVSGTNSLWFNGNITRSATTRPLDIPYGGEIGFWLRFGTTDTAPWEMPDLPGEGIVVEYSVDNGATFVPLAVYDSSEFLTWTRRSVALPAGAYGTATLVRWRQLAHSGNNTDHWALEDVAVTLYASPQPVQFLRQPASQTVEAGVTVALTPVVAGTEPISYQWSKDGLPLAGATSLDLILTQVTTNAAGIYSLNASNALGQMASEAAVVTVIPVLTLSEALDAPDLLWTSGGTAPWRGQTAVTYDGEDAGQSGLISHGQDTWVETSVNGPGTLAFWWSVSSEAGYDYLEFRTNGILATRISGFTSWGLVSQRIGAGSHTLRWRYSKDLSVHSGQDKGWVDQVVFVPDGPEPVVLAHPVNRSVIVGDPATFSVVASGAEPLSYQWWRDGAPIPGATLPSYTLSNCQLSDAGSAFTCVVTNSHGAVTSGLAMLTVVPGFSLCGALDACELNWATGGTAPWTGQTMITHDGVDAAQTGTITHDQETWLETTVVGPGSLSFWWKVSSEAEFDYLDLLINDDLVDWIDGEVDWSFMEVPLGPGTHTLRWFYSKDGSVNSGQDKGWVDQVSFAPDNPAPQIATQPQNQTVAPGSAATFTVLASGSPPLSYFWTRDGNPIAGATQNSYTLANCQFADSGSRFQCLVTNVHGTALSAEATLTVAHQTTLTFSAPGLIAIPAFGSATPYPSTLQVNGVSGNLFKVTATLNQISHTYPDDLDILLVGPSGQKVMLMSDAGEGESLVNVTLTFDPLATISLPNSTQIIGGTYLPTDYESGEAMPAPAPPGPYGTDLGVFNGTNPNGLWQLFVADDASFDSGNISGGWVLQFSMAASSPPAFLPPYVVGANLHLRFETMIGPTYVIEYSDSMQPGSWQMLQSVEGDGEVHTVLDVLQGVPHRFYRLRRD